jgi:hypothetical protein
MTEPIQLLFLIILTALITVGFFVKSKLYQLSSVKYYSILLFTIVYIVVSRTFFLGQLPAGLNQDEAAIGYDAWALSQYGIDRNGYPFPILPMSWGSGSGGFVIYFASLLFRFLPLTVYNLRLANAIIQLLALSAFFIFLKRFFSKEIALIGLVYLSINPWHFMLSRWNLDANQVFALILIGILLSSIGFENKKKRFHYLAMIFFSFAMYSYGSGVIVVPLLLVTIYGIALLKKTIALKLVIGLMSWITFISIPLITFYIINTFRLSEVITPWFSIPLFNTLRSNSVIIPFDDFFFTKVWANLADSIQYLTTGKSDWLWNQLPDYGISFLFTFPLLFLGLTNQRYQPKSLPFYLWFAISFIFSLILYQNTNRMGVLFLPMIYFQVQGMAWLIRKPKVIWTPILGIIATASVLFHMDYTTIYARDIKPYFAYGYGDAITFSLNLDKQDYRLPSQNLVNGSHVLALFYIQPNPHDVVDTGIYLNPGAEFQYLSSFESGDKQFSFIDPIPNQNISDHIVFITKTQNLQFFDSTLIEVTYFSDFIVIYKT